MTQNALVLSALEARRGQWVEMPELAKAAGCFAVHSRISNLREAGHMIMNKIEGKRPRKSFYKLLEN